MEIGLDSEMVRSKNKGLGRAWRVAWIRSSCLRSVVACGPQPATRLPGNLTPQVAGALATAVRTDAAAAAALSVHLNQGPAFFGMLQLSDVTPDGSAIRVPPGRARPLRRGITLGAGGWYG